ncbi:SDR family NAD(P)-dependent oxidoreductase [Nocardioides marmorisolisilvae]|uniref:SDR family NAD(P)-dependent oxidoreductase n=1 Tax=Nocardioides marmorisolisilvae TaxID=1542737 RepID=A0A3N0DPR6_9ACTN|nr:SDR family NAD(P)-dependent oxidoreductase [Nocardioides marmorisolisilvae]RNL77647.1 SDR family NAD(P)-dependent oxidoreductase [Nocardioides marmorisolisilvae]
MGLEEKYGPWALVAGASEGVGALFAEELAARGLNVVLLARRQATLDEVAAGIRERSGVQTRTLAVDLATPGAAAEVTAALADLEIGMLVYCAGADADYAALLDKPVSTAEALIHRNCTVLVQLCHAFAGPMVARGRGGIVIFGSGSSFAGAPKLATYGGTKAFDMVFAEGLWAELKPQGVDVLGLVLGETDTPALRRMRHQLGLAATADERPPAAASAAAVVADGLANLGNGPIRMADRKLRLGSRAFFPMGRNLMAKMMAQATVKTMEPRKRG